MVGKVLYTENLFIASQGDGLRPYRGRCQTALSDQARLLIFIAIIDGPLRTLRDSRLSILEVQQLLSSQLNNIDLRYAMGRSQDALLFRLHVQKYQSH